MAVCVCVCVCVGGAFVTGSPMRAPPHACPSSCVGPVVYGKLETTENKTLCAVGARNLGVKLDIVDTTAAPALYIVGR